MKKITVNTEGMTDKQAVVAFLQGLKHRRTCSKVKKHTYELNTLNVAVSCGKTIMINKG